MMTAKAQDILKLFGLLVLTLALVYGLLTVVDHQFRADPRADHFITVEEKLLATSLYGDDTLQELIRKDEVTFDPTVGRTMGETIQYLKQTSVPKVLIIGPSTFAYVEGDSSPQFYIHRVDKALKRLSTTPIEVYNLATEGMHAQEMINVLEKASLRVSFDYVLVGMGLHVLYHNNVRPTLEDLPDPDPNLVVANLHFDGDLPWFAPPELNARAENTIQNFLSNHVPLFRNRVAIQKWSGQRLMGMTTNEEEATGSSVVDTANPGGAGVVDFNDGAGVANADFSTWENDLPTGWNVDPGAVSFVKPTSPEDADGAHGLQIDAGNYKYAVLTQTVAASEPLGGHAVRLRAKVRTEQPDGLTKIGLVIEGENIAVRHPCDGEWHTLEVTYTYPYDAKDKKIEIKLSHTNASRAPTHPAFFTEIQLETVAPQPAKQFYLTEPMIDAVNANVDSLLDYLAAYRNTHEATVALVPGPYYQSEEQPVYFPPYLEDAYMDHLRQRCDEQDLALIDARAVVPNAYFHMSSKLPSRDGVHFDGDGHTALAEYLLVWLREQGL